MHVVVLGAGMQGTACAYDLCRSDGVKEVVIADVDLKKAEQATKKVQEDLKNSAPDAKNVSQIAGNVERRYKISAATIDVTQHSRLAAFLRSFDVAISAVPYFYNVAITKACVESKTHLVDMGGNTDVVFEQRAFDEKARTAGICILPDCGLAPGLASILTADAVSNLDATHSVAINVGGLPQHPVPPLNYQLFFSIHGLINEYCGKAVILENAKRREVDTLSDLETLYFDDFDTPFEAAITLGGLSTMPWTYEGQIKSLTYKTLRYPGHWAIMQAMNQLGVFDEAPVKLNGTNVSPRALFTQQAEPRLTWESMKDRGARPEDMVLVRVSATGEKNAQRQTLVYEIVDRFDHTTGFTAMMRMTAFPVSIVAQMLGNNVISERGVLALEQTIPTQTFIDALKQRDIDVQIKVQETLKTF